MTCPHSYSDGAYVLGALSPPDRCAYESHLAGCGDCATAVARLAPVPGLLGRVDPAVIHRRDPAGPEPDPRPPEPLARLIQVVGAERRRQARARRWQLAAAVLGSVVLAVVGTAAWLGLVRGEPADELPPGPPVLVEEGRMQPILANVPVTAEVELTETAAGTEVWLHCAYPGPGSGGRAHVFRLVAVGADGTREQVGSWLAAPGDDLTMTGVTRFTGTELARLELRGYHNTYLLSYVVS